MNRIVVSKLISIAEELIKQADFVDADQYGTEYFVNPKLQELDAIESGAIRFIAENDTQNVWAWNSEILHLQAVNFLGISDAVTIDVCDRYLLGTAEKQGGKYIMIASDVLEYLLYESNKEDKKICARVLEDFFSIDWSWIENYSISVNSYLDKMYEIYKEKFKG